MNKFTPKHANTELFLQEIMNCQMTSVFQCRIDRLSIALLHRTELSGNFGITPIPARIQSIPHTYTQYMFSFTLSDELSSTLVTALLSHYCIVCKDDAII